MAIAVDDTTIGGFFSSSTVVNETHTCTGSDLVLVVGVMTTGGTVSGITYNGVSLTKVDAITNGARRSEIWYLINPATGSNTIATTFSASSSGEIFGVSYTGADQTTQPDASTTDNFSTSPYSLTLTTLTDDAWMTAMVSGNRDLSGGTGTVRRAMTAGLDWGMLDSDGSVGTAGSNSLEITQPSPTTTASVTMAVKPVVAATGTNMQINISDVWKTVDGLQINIGDSWKTVTAVKQNIGDSWKDVF